MREHLFKAKRIDNGEWVEGNLIKMNSDNNCQTFIFPFYEYASTLSCAQLVSFGMISVIPETVSEYTGLTDKNGNKIFENDLFIPRYNGFDETPVVYEKGSFNISFFNVKQCEIIGNIFDNPKLLTAEV